ncbi:MAG: hypothetical protein ACPGVK_10515 [Halocynthiibacter sp.]
MTYFLKAICGALLVTGAANAEFALNSYRADQPHRIGDVDTFQLTDGGCSELRYNLRRFGGETTDCAQRRQRIEYRETQGAKAGETRIYEWDMLVPKEFRFASAGGWLVPAHLHDRDGVIYNFSLQDDGLWFHGGLCIDPDEFGTWHRVSLTVTYDATRKASISDKTAGVVQVRCNGELIRDLSGRPNILPNQEAFFGYGLMGPQKIVSGDMPQVSFRNVSVTRP